MYQLKRARFFCLFVCCCLCCLVVLVVVGVVIFGVGLVHLSVLGIFVCLLLSVLLVFCCCFLVSGIWGRFVFEYLQVFCLFLSICQCLFILEYFW